jgi:hypothetical protein
VNSLELQDSRKTELFEVGSMLEDKKLYQNLIGQLNSLTLNTRYDVSYAVNQLAQKAQNPLKEHLNVAKRLILYLRDSAENSLVYQKGPGNKFTVEAFCDASFSRTEDCKSTVGFIVLINNNVYKYRSKKLKFITDSVCETEYMSIYFVLKEVQALFNIFDFLGIKAEKPVIFNDNRRAVELVMSKCSIERTKHIKRKYLLEREAVLEGDACVEYVKTDDNPADLFTKALPKNKHKKFVDMFMITSDQRQK